MVSGDVADTTVRRVAEAWQFAKSDRTRGGVSESCDGRLGHNRLDSMFAGWGGRWQLLFADRAALNLRH